MINATDLAVTEVNWPGYPPLFQVGSFEVQQAMDVMQVHFFSPPLNVWVKLVPQRTGEPGVLEVTVAELGAIQQYQAQGVPRNEAIRRVLGFLPA